MTSKDDVTAKQIALIERFEWVLQTRKGTTIVVEGKPLNFNPTSWSKAAGVSRGLIEQILARRHQGNVSFEIAGKLAAAAGVRPEWLLNGAGPRDIGAAPQEREIEIEDQFPSREQFIEIAKAEGANEGTIKALRKVRCDPGTAPDVAYWRREFLRLERERLAFRADLNAVPDEDD